jgi:glycolate oxidase
MQFAAITSADITFFQTTLGNAFVLTDSEALHTYGHDETEDLVYLPEVVLKPANAAEISAIVKHCNSHNIPVTTRGGGTGLSGAALPVHGGVILSMERFNKIVEIDERNLQVIVEPGVITQVLQETVLAKGLYYPPDPSSRGSCFIGGNIAHNSGGPRAVKYGVVKDYVLNLQVVLASGEIIWTGANTLKNSTGYNLTQLMVGSEGTLGIVTQIVLKLIPAPAFNLVMLVPFYSAERACEAVSAVFRAGIVPSAMEFMERDAIDWVLQYRTDIAVTVEPDVKAHLLIEVDGSDMDVLFKDCERITEVMQAFDAGEVLFAESAAEKDALWKMRRSVAEAVKSNSVYKEEDTVVPRAELAKLLKGVKEIGAAYGFKSVCYGHAGDGNLHINIVKGTLTDDVWQNELPKAIRQLFELTVSLGGTLSGEHGIGWVQKPYMDIAFGETSLSLQKGIKQVFDPNGILNPGKIF